MQLTRQKLLFLALFTILGFVTLQIPVNKLAGSNVSFTLFDFFGPIAGSFVGTVYGIGIVFVIEILNILVRHTPITFATIIRLFPTLFGLYYFSMSKKKIHAFFLLVPLLAIVSFIANPIGRQVWYYSLFWTIPILTYGKRNNLLLRSLGATFTAHAVGGAVWIWVFHLQASIWRNLIPIVIEERALFTFGIAASFLFMRYIAQFLVKKRIISFKIAIPSY